MQANADLKSTARTAPKGVRRNVKARALRLVGALSHVFPSAVAALAEYVMVHPRRRCSEVAGEAMSGVLSSGLRYRHWPGRGKPVLMLHGWEGDSSQFSGMAEALSARGCRVFALDAPAHGRSPGTTATPVDFIAGIADLCAAFGEPVHLIGHSIGAAAIMCAVRQGLQCESLVLIAPPLHFSETFHHFNQRIGLGPEASAKLEASMEARIGRSFRSLDLTAAPPSQAALLIHDRSDRVVPYASSEALAKSYPNFTLLTTEGLGHHGVLDAPLVWAAIVQKYFFTRSNE